MLANFILMDLAWRDLWLRRGIDQPARRRFARYGLPVSPRGRTSP